MPHQCVRCSKLYPDGSNEILSGCSCGGKFFFFIRDIGKAQQIIEDLTKKEKEQMEKDVLDIVKGKVEEGTSLFLDIESVRILKPGKYELDLIQLFRGKPLIYKLEDGKYVIDLLSTFEAKEL